MLEEVLKLKNSKEFIEFGNYYSDFGFLGLINLFRFEDANTNFLASLLNKNNYNLGDYPLKLLIELIAVKSEKKLFEDTDILSDAITSIHVKPQNVIDKSSRLDLLIEFELNSKPFSIIIEAKLFASLDNEQLKKYNSKKFKGKEIYVFLSCEKNPFYEKNPKDVPKDYIVLTYEDIINNVYLPCIYKGDEKTKFIIESYIKGFNTLYYEDVKFENIPLSNIGRDLTLLVWNSHKNIIQELLKNDEDNPYSLKELKKSNLIFRVLVINLLKMSDELGLDKEKLSKVLDKNRYYFQNEPYKGIAMWLKAVFEYLNKEGYHYNDLDGLIDIYRVNKLIASKNEIPKMKNPEYYKEDYSVTIDGKKYYIIYKWNSLEYVELKVKAKVFFNERGLKI